MAIWRDLSVREAISKIKNQEIVLPVIQRRLVWEEDSMELLFDSLLKGNSFGSIICIEEERNTKPLFAFRQFTPDGEMERSIERDELSKNHWFVIDGQQRLQSFYIGLCGSYHGKRLYFDLFSDFAHSEYDFKFAEQPDKLSKQNRERAETGLKDCLWCAVDALYDRLNQTRNSDQVAEEWIKKYGLEDHIQIRHVERNVRRFFEEIFSGSSIGISTVNINRSLDDVENRQMIVELFRRLNDGGTKLSSYDLAASMFKGFDYKMESYLDEITREYSALGVDQDTFIKLILILNDKPTKEMVDLTVEDAEYATDNYERISKSLCAMRNFLKASGHEKWFLSTRKRSVIPLYFIVYHIFYSDIPTDRLGGMFDRFDTADKNFCSMKSWLQMSLMNRVFSRGCGWIPYRTGVRKIHAVMKAHKGGQFPKDDLLRVYKTHPLNSFSDCVTDDSLGSFDRDYLFYLLYNASSSFRAEDIDHIHPKSLLESRGYDYSEINTICNYQLLEAGTNRGEKNGRELYDWISEYVEPENLSEYLRRHHIPDNPELWKSENYQEFLRERTVLLIRTLRDAIS